MAKKVNFVGCMLLSAMVIMGMLSGCNGAGANAKGTLPDAMPPMLVPVMVAQAKPVEIVSEYLATLKSRNSSTIDPQVEGQITHIYVKSGDTVKAGTALIQIDPLKQQATTGSQEALRVAKEANLRLAKDQLERTRKLHAAGVVSKQSLDEAQTAHDAAQADVRSAEAQVQQQNVQLRYYRIVSPSGGVVGDIPVHIGDRVAPGTVLTTVNQSGGLEAYIEVPVERSAELSVGKKVEILGSDGKPIAQSNISFVSPEVNDATQTVLVKAAIKDLPGLRSEQLVRVRIVWGVKPAILIPILAISRVNGQSFVFVAEQGDKTLVAKQRQLRLGEMIGNEYVVLEGIQTGDKVIIGNTQMLGEGAPVQPQS